MPEIGDKVKVYDEHSKLEKVGVVVEIYPDFVRCEFKCGRGRTYYESFNLPLIEQDFWRFGCGKR